MDEGVSGIVFGMAHFRNNLSVTEALSLSPTGMGPWALVVAVLGADAHCSSLLDIYVHMSMTYI